jgi:uncharacterized membrane protein HdeD (DUF308 family)
MFAQRFGLNWWSLVLQGVVSILFGVLVIIWPAISVAVLLALFGIFALLDGIFAISAAVGTAEGRQRWWSLLIVGLIGIAAGIVTFSYPGITALALYFIIAIWAFVIGIFQIIAAITGVGDVSHRWLWAFSGILSVLFAILLFTYPAAGIAVVVWLIGFYALLHGITLIMLGFQLRGFGSQLRGAVQH